MCVCGLNISEKQCAEMLTGFLYTFSRCVDNERKHLIHLLLGYECIKLFWGHLRILFVKEMCCSEIYKSVNTSP